MSTSVLAVLYQRICSRSVTLVLVLGSYGAIALAANWPVWPGSESSLRQGDLSFLTWSLSWTVYALLHHHNLLYTTWLNFPQGVNLAQNTLMPLLGLMTLPLTLLHSPIASINLLLWLAFCLSSASMFFVLSKWTNRRLSAYLGGLIYGFSPYMIGQGLDHVVQNFVPLPPLIFYAFWKLLVEEKTLKIRWGIGLGLLLMAQLFISPEVAVSSVIVISLGAAILSFASPAVALQRTRRALPGLVATVLVIVIPAGYYIIALTTGAQHALGPSLGSGLSADLLGPLLPTANQRFGLFGLAKIGNSFIAGNFPENGTYIGLPILLLVILIVVQEHRQKRILFVTAMAVIMLLLSLGPRLIIDSHITSVPLPSAMFSHLPLVGNLAEVRLSLYVDFFIACILAFGIDQVDLAGIRRSILSRNHSRMDIVSHLAVLLLGVAAVLTCSLTGHTPMGQQMCPQYSPGGLLMPSKREAWY